MSKEQQVSEKSPYTEALRLIKEFEKVLLKTPEFTSEVSKRHMKVLSWMDYDAIAKELRKPVDFTRGLDSFRFTYVGKGLYSNHNSFILDVRNSDGAEEKVCLFPNPKSDIRNLVYRDQSGEYENKGAVQKVESVLQRLKQKPQPSLKR